MTDDFLDTIPDETVLEMQEQIRDYFYDIYDDCNDSVEASLYCTRSDRVYSELKRLQDKDRAVTERARELTGRHWPTKKAWAELHIERGAFIIRLASCTFPDEEAK